MPEERTTHDGGRLQTPGLTDCPPEMELAQLVERRLSEPDAERVRQHVALCTTCNEAVGALSEQSRMPTLTLEPGTGEAIAGGMLREGAPEGNGPGSRTLDRKYRLLRILGRGGMGEVHEAEHTGTGRHVAVKLINARFLALSEEARRRFKREARAGGGVDSPHIVEVLDAGEDEESGDLYLVMEQLRGEDLQDLIDRVGPLAPDVALRIAAQALQGLMKAHEAGVIHRDIKPSNLFLARRGDGEVIVKVLDFGIAKVTTQALQLAETAGLTHTEGLLGTPLYMSPEQVQSSKDVDPRTDLWSLGSVLYCALAGHAPFSNAASAAGKLMVAICADRPPPLRDRAPWVAPEVAEAVHVALKKDPDKRYPSAGAMLDALCSLVPEGIALREGMLTGVPPEMRSDAPVPPQASWRPPPGSGPPPPDLPPARSWLRSRPRWQQGLGAALVIATSVGVVAAFVPRREPPLRAEPPPPAGTPQRITSGPSWAAEPAISPDGKLVAYVSDAKGSSDIWVVDARGGDPRRLTDDPAEDRTPAWFPDGKTIAFASDRGGQEGIWRVRVEGGPATLIVPGVDPAISPDGKHIAFARADAHAQYLVTVAPLDDPSATRVLTPHESGSSQHRHPAWSPDGSRLAYQSRHRMWIVPVAGGQPTVLDHEDGIDDWPSFAPDGRHLYVSSTRKDTSALWRLSTTDEKPLRITLGSGPEVEPNVSRDGARLAYSTYNEETSLILVDLTKGTQAHMPDVEDFGLAPDGGEVAYVSSRQAHVDLWAQPIDRHASRGDARRGDPQRLTVDLPGAISRPAFSPDGRWIAAQWVVDAEGDICILPRRGGTPEKIASDGARHFEPAWSHDGAFLAFLSYKGGIQQVWTVPVAGGRAAGAARQVTFDDTVKSMPTWSPRDDEIAYTVATSTKGGGEIDIVPVAGGAPRRIALGAGIYASRWDRATGDIYASGTWGERLMSLRRVSPSTGETKPLEPEVSFGNVALGLFEVSLDGTTLALRREEARGDIWVLDDAKGSGY